MRSVFRRCTARCIICVPVVVASSMSPQGANDIWDTFSAQQTHRYVIVLELERAGFQPRPEEIRAASEAYARAVQAAIPRNYRAVTAVASDASTACDGYSSCDLITIRQEPLGWRGGTRFRYLVESKKVRAPVEQHYRPSRQPIDCQTDIAPEAIAWSICRTQKQDDFVAWFNQVEPQEHWSRNRDRT
jgi:hypothetical protein